MLFIISFCYLLYGWQFVTLAFPSFQRHTVISIYLLYSAILFCGALCWSLIEKDKEKEYLDEYFGWWILFLWFLFGGAVRDLLQLGNIFYVTTTCFLIVLEFAAIVRVWGDKIDKTNCLIYYKFDELSKYFNAVSSLRNEINNLKKNIPNYTLDFKAQNELLSKINDNVESLRTTRNFNKDILREQYEMLLLPLSSVPFFQDRFNSRIISALEEVDVLSMFHLCSLSREELLNIKGINYTSVDKIETFLKQNNLCLGMDTKLFVQLYQCFFPG